MIIPPQVAVLGLEIRDNLVPIFSSPVCNYFGHPLGTDAAQNLQLPVCWPVAALDRYQLQKDSSWFLTIDDPPVKIPRDCKSENWRIRLSILIYGIAIVLTTGMPVVYSFELARSFPNYVESSF